MNGRGGGLIDGLYEACNNIAFGYLNIGGEFMSAIRFRKAAKVDFPFLSYIFLKPEPLRA